MTEAILQKIDKERVFGHSFILDDAFALLKGGREIVFGVFFQFLQILRKRILPDCYFWIEYQ